MKETIFLEDLKRFAAVSKAKKWSTTIVHDGGHPVDDDWLKKNSQGEVKHFSTKEYNKTMNEIKDKIKAGKIGAKDRLMIFISTHGRENKEDQSGHNVRTNDGVVNTASFQDLRDLAEKKGIRLAIIDTSCYSGASLKLATDKTCVVTSAADDVAYSGDSFRLLDAMNSEKNLEEAFLKARLSKTDKVQPGQPQISTEEGKQIQDLLDPFSEDLHDIHRSIDAETNTEKCNTRPHNIEDFKKLLDKIDPHQSMMKELQVQNYKKKLQDYRQQKNEAIDTFNRLRNADTKVCYKTKANFKSCLNLSSIAVTMDYHRKQIADKKDSLGISKEMMAELTKISNSPQYKNYIADTEKVKKLADQTYETSRQISKIERELYYKLYSQQLSKNTKGNPCRDFKL
ncbi:MAG: hypothetical protein ACXWQA_05245 [Pseudobdellovibrionaceae bacterium]